ncbi:MAG: hypothetical protein ABSD74_14410 [Rhizomicrobium sp.]|jgi:hypothetical protein
MTDLPVMPGAASSGAAPFLEQQLFDRSPLGTFGTAAVLFLVCLGSFEALALFAGYPLSDQLSLRPSEGAWPAMILSLLLAVALGMQRYTRLKDMKDTPALDQLMACDARQFAVDRPDARRRVRNAAWIGMVAGLGLSFVSVPSGVLEKHLALFLWFAAIQILLGAMFSRGIVLSRIASRGFAERIDRDLKVDLLRVDDLSLIARSSARVALVWLCVAAVISLFFVNGGASWTVISIIVLSGGMAFWIFFRPLQHVHKRIREAKRAELDRLRKAIAEQREQATHDHTAASRLHGLLAYETRIEHVHEWPFDQLTLLRVASYVLIPASPALGQIAMRYFTHAAP